MINIWRIIKFGFQNFLRNRWLAVSTISIMVLTLFVSEGLILFNAFSQNAINSIQDKVDISVYFKSTAPEDSILNIKRVLEGFDEVKTVSYTSKEEALKIFKEKHAGDETITKTLDELGENPLLPSLNIKAKELSQYSTIASYLDSPSLKDIVNKVTYAQNTTIINRLRKLVDALNIGVFSLTLFLAFLAVVITFNTISLAIFSNRDQIGIMRVVGASNRFIRGPYIVEGIIYGVIAAVIGFVVFIPLINFLSPKLLSFLPTFNLKAYFGDNIFSLFFYQLALGVGLGVVSSIIAIRRYLKV